MFKKKQICQTQNVWAKHQEERHSKNEKNDEECWHCDIERWRRIQYKWKEWLNWQRFE